jgi:hypothetical protein
MCAGEIIFRCYRFAPAQARRDKPSSLYRRPPKNAKQIGRGFQRVTGEVACARLVRAAMVGLFPRHAADSVWNRDCPPMAQISADDDQMGMIILTTLSVFIGDICG